jgi:hypothetical protein
MLKRPDAAGLCLALVMLAGCNRNLEPFDPAEQPRQPDLSRIFPAGAEGPEIAQNAPTEMPPPPGMPGMPGMQGGEESADTGGEPIRGTLRVAPELASAQPAGAVLFLIARTNQPGPPLAVKRIEGPRFPLDFEIGPDDRMIKSRPFVGPLQITARLDADGNATSRTPGDLQGTAKSAVNPGDSGVELVLDERL